MLKDKVVIITGAGRGIGKALALATAAEGAKIGCISRSATELLSVVNEIDAFKKNNAYYEVADVACNFSIQGAIEKPCLKLGEIDALVINTGVNGESSSVLNSDSDGWSSVIDVNLKGAFDTAKAGLHHIKKGQSAKLLLLGSGIGHKGAKNSSAYACSKAGTWVLTKVLSEELKGTGLRSTKLFPDWVIHQ